MKQHITVEQLEELEPEKYIKLVEKEYGTSMCNKYAKIENCKRLFNIGKLIEILENKFDKSYSIEFKKKSDFNDDYACGKYELFVLSSNYGGVVLYKENDELCDALWQAVKEVL